MGIFKKMGGNIPGGNFPGWNSPGGSLIGGNFPGGKVLLLFVTFKDQALHECTSRFL